MKLFSIPPHVPFLNALAAWWLARRGDDPLAVADGLILLPTRRAARGLTDAFLRASNGRPLLLPRIAALGALDEAPLALRGALDLPPAVAPATRLAVLTRLIIKLQGQNGAPDTADRAWPLAAELAQLLDEAHRAEVDLALRLPDAALLDHAVHWQRTVQFLQIVTHAWPAWLEEQGLMDAAARAGALLDRQAAEWEAAQPRTDIVIAGTTGGIPAVARLIRTALRLPAGTVVLPGLDFAMAEPVWDALDDGHPQAGLRRLLSGLAATRADVTSWPAPGHARVPAPGHARGDAIARALLPAPALGTWREPFVPDIAGLSRLTAADQQEEAVAIALILRNALETPHASAALVTPDRALAGRVAAELRRFGIVADDSAGELLADTPPAILLRLLARVVAEGFGPVALLSVLKHPLAALGLAPAQCRAAARTLERACLRGPAPAPGLAGLRDAAQNRQPERTADLLARLETCFAPILAIAAQPDATPRAALQALIACAEAVAATEEEPGTRLWSGEEGEALAQHLAALLDALPLLPAQPVGTLPGLLEASMAGIMIRTRRALRGLTGGEHPRVAILGLLESRLQHFDVLVLGGLAETVWPPATDPGPWMSRPMRARAGLPSPEEVVGQMAHDFAMLTGAAPTVVLSCPSRRDGAPAVPARWLVRLEAFLAGHGTRLPGHPAAHWARTLDRPAGDPRPVRPPAPRPAAIARPRRLSVTEIETWLRDPYAIYAKHVLNLRKLDPLEQSADAADYGTIVHAALAAFLTALPPSYPPDAGPRLRAEMGRALDAAGLRPALTAWWRPRLMRIADWVAVTEQERRQVHRPALVRSEVKGAWSVPHADFELTGRADRIERLPDGTIAILDYKTGATPSNTSVRLGLAPQLPLEAVMASAGVFGEDVAGQATELTYWHLTGGFTPGKVEQMVKKETENVVNSAERNLVALIHCYDDPTRAYLSQPHPGAAPRFSDYAQLARVAEWSALEDDP